MDPLLIAVGLASLLAAAFGGMLGMCIGFAKAGADPLAHPLLAALVRRRNPLVNVPGTFIAWGLVLYGVPTGVLYLFGIRGVEALGLSMVFQFCAVFVFLLVAERARALVDSR